MPRPAAPEVVTAAACQVKVPPPVLVMVTVWETGPGWPGAALKSSVAGVAASIGAAGCPRMNVTGMVCVPPDQLKSTEPGYVPGFKPAALTLTEGEVGVTALVLLIFIQLPPLLVLTIAFQYNTLDHHCLSPTLIDFCAGDGYK